MWNGKTGSPIWREQPEEEIYYENKQIFSVGRGLGVLVGFVGTAMAQGKMDSKGTAYRLPPQPIQPIVSVSAIEITDGTVGMDIKGTETAFGYSFMGQTTGSLPGTFTLSMNCAPALPIPGYTSEVSGGSWTLPVYMTSIKGGTTYAGSLYGTIDKGTMSWDKTGRNATVYILLNVNGTQTWEGVGGYASFAGTLYVDEKTQETMLDGTLVFTLINPIPE
jgi:hypothetical protein